MSNPYRHAEATRGPHLQPPSACRCGATLLRVGIGECARCEREKARNGVRAHGRGTLAILCVAAFLGVADAAFAVRMLATRSVTDVYPVAVSSVTGTYGVSCTENKETGLATCVSSQPLPLNTTLDVRNGQSEPRWEKK